VTTTAVAADTTVTSEALNKAAANAAVKFDPLSSEATTTANTSGEVSGVGNVLATMTRAMVVGEATT
jgi:hypothetical protein